jgi:hypothetical protein
MPVARFGDRINGLRVGDVLMRALPKDDEEVLIDLSAVRFSDPSGLVSLVTACLDAIEMGNNLAIVAPDERNVANYLLRMNFRDLLRDEGVRFVGGFASWDVRARALENRLLELQGVDSSNAEAVCESLLTLGEASGVPASVLQPAVLGLAEAVDNTLEHAGCERAIVMAQRYRADAGRLRLEVAVGDTGVGLRQTLRRKYTVPDDATAVALAIEKGVSKKQGGGRRGNGLSSIVEAVCRTAGGSFQLRSGDASISVRGRGGAFARSYPTSRYGVQLTLSLTSNAPG